jgi:hypothetical protein
MSLLFLDHFRKRPPAPDFQETVKAPRVLFDFVAKRASSIAIPVKPEPSWDTRRINSNTSGKAEISNIFD